MKVKQTKQPPLAINIAVQSLKSNPLTITEQTIFIDGTEQAIKVLWDPTADEYVLEEQPSAISGLLDIQPKISRNGYQTGLKSPVLAMLSSFDQNSGPRILETFSCFVEPLNATFSYKRGDKVVYADGDELVKIAEPIYGLGLAQTSQDRTVMLVVSCNKYKNGYYGERKSHEIGFVYLYELVEKSDEAGSVVHTQVNSVQHMPGDFEKLT